MVHYSDKQELTLLTCDPSPYGVGAVLSHVMDDGSEHLVHVAYASRSLSAAEKNYAELDKEALAIVFRVTKFWQYLLGRRFMTFSNHKPIMLTR